MNPHGLKDRYATAFQAFTQRHRQTLQSPITSAQRVIEGCEAGSTTKAGLTACQTARCLLYSEYSCFALGLKAHVGEEGRACSPLPH